ncbi:MAG: 50S ribosomal protein L18 [Euryarchaeota archaeon]|nr:50S ribosomal protein L18 [Euryarchaeota archaeon]
MAHNAIYRVKMRRRREGKTDYRKRLTLLKSGMTRAVIRRTNTRMIVQFVDYREDGDHVILTVTSDVLKNYGWNRSFKSIPAAYLAGYLAGKKAIEKGIEEAVLDIGRHYAHNGSRIFAALKGILDAGVYVPHGEGIFPDEDRISGKHISEEVEKLFNEVKSKMEV